MTRVAHLSSVHPTFDTRVFWKECCTLSDLGYDVHLVIPHDQPNDVVHGVTIHGLHRPSGRVERVTSHLRTIARTAAGLNADIYHFHDPDLMAVGMWLARTTDAKVIYDSHENMELVVLDRDWIPSMLRVPVSKAVVMVERIACRFFDAVISAEPGGLDRLPVDKRTLVRNLPLLGEFASSVPKVERNSNVTYIGSITRARGAVQMVEAMGLLGPATNSQLMLAGVVGDSGLKEELASLPGFSRVTMPGRIERPQVVEILSTCAVGLVTLQPTAQYLNATQPVKLFEYLASGIAVVASDFDSWRSLLGEDPPVVFVDPTNPQAIADAISGLLMDADWREDLGRRGQQLVTSKFSWESEITALDGVYQKLLAAEGSA